MPPDHLLELFDIDPIATELPESVRPEPVLAAAPFFVEFDEPERLDPGRATAEAAELPPRRWQRSLPIGLAGSVVVHLLPLLVLLHWSSAPAEIAPPIPVQLVLEEPPPAPKAEKPKPPPPGRRASEEMGETASEPGPPATVAAPAAARPGETQVAAALPPPKPIPRPEPISALPKPAPAPELAAIPLEPKPTPLVIPPVKQAVTARLAPSLHPAPRAQVPGPAATRDEYLAYCETLIRRYYDMLPVSFLGGRHGTTNLSILVLDDGTIARIAVAQSSGYPDIDGRIEQMVAAVRRFPPLPQWVQGPSIMMVYHHAFPNEH